MGIVLVISMSGEIQCGRLVVHPSNRDSSWARLIIVYNYPQLEMLSGKAWSIATGHLGENDIFYADELLLTCPTKYQEEVLSQVVHGK